MVPPPHDGLKDSPSRAEGSDMSDFQWATGTDVLAAIEAGADLWDVEPADPDDDEDHDVQMAFDDVFAHEYSAAIDAVVDALNDAAVPHVDEVSREDREVVLITATDDDVAPDVAHLRALADEALRTALAAFGPARDE